jgi:hypothetical protein
MVIMGRHFEHERVVLGGRHFQGCTFIGCELVYDGRPVQLLDNRLEDCSWVFEGAAAVTLEFIAALCREHAEMRLALVRALGLLDEAAPERPAVIGPRH